MKSKTELILNSVALIFIGPLLGLIIAAVAYHILWLIIVTAASIIYFAASIFFDVDDSSLGRRYDFLKTTVWNGVLICGLFGGIIWTFFEINKRWKKFKQE